MSASPTLGVKVISKLRAKYEKCCWRMCRQKPDALCDLCGDEFCMKHTSMHEKTHKPRVVDVRHESGTPPW